MIERVSRTYLYIVWNKGEEWKSIRKLRNFTVYLLQGTKSVPGGGSTCIHQKGFPPPPKKTSSISWLFCPETNGSASVRVLFATLQEWFGRGSSTSNFQRAKLAICQLFGLYIFWGGKCLLLPKLSLTQVRHMGFVLTERLCGLTIFRSSAFEQFSREGSTTRSKKSYFRPGPPDSPTLALQQEICQSCQLCFPYTYLVGLKNTLSICSDRQKRENMYQKVEENPRLVIWAGRKRNWFLLKADSSSAVEKRPLVDRFILLLHCESGEKKNNEAFVTWLLPNFLVQLLYY